MKTSLSGEYTEESAILLDISPLLIILGCILLSNKLFVTSSLPIIFAVWVVIEGVTIAVLSFDYKKFHFDFWWVLLLIGIVAVVLGILGLRNPLVAADTLSALGVSYLVAVFGINKLQKALGK